MPVRPILRNQQQLDELIPSILRKARIPGAAIAVVSGNETVLARAFGDRDLKARLPVTPETVYPIASTSKAINATLIGMLVDEGLLEWDTPAQTYVPWLRFNDPLLSTQVTLRDLVLMRTGLPRHDWLWEGYPIGRRELVESLRHLELAGGFREKFQYNNLTATTAGFIAEAVTGERWEDLVQRKLLDPLHMTSTTFSLPTLGDDATQSYHESSRRELVASQRLATESTAPSGGSLHSTVLDMARWISLNLSRGRTGDRELITARSLAEIHSPQVLVGSDSASPTPGAAYALGWFVDRYSGRLRVSHGGYLHDVNSEISLFPEESLGIVSFTNFGCPTLARLINQHCFDVLMGLEPAQTLDDKLAEYERGIERVRERSAALPRVEHTRPSHSLTEYAGTYRHRAYGAINIDLDQGDLILTRDRLIVRLEHWHYDTWLPRDSDVLWIHMSHAFDRASPILFETSAAGAIAAVSIRLEPAVAPIRFEKT